MWIGASTCRDETICIDVLISQFSESVTSSLVLDKSSEVVWVRIIRFRTNSYRGAVSPPICDSTIFGGILYHHYECLGWIQILIGFGGIFVTCLKIRCNTDK